MLCALTNEKNHSMTRMTHSLVISTILLTLSAVLMTATTFAQPTQSRSAETQLGERIVRVARPTLKRRGQPADLRPAVTEERRIQVKCDEDVARQSGRAHPVLSTSP